MDIHGLFYNVAKDGVKWIVEKLSAPSKKELYLKISDLEQQIETLSNGNQYIVQNFQEILNIILKELGKKYSLSINSDTIVIAIGNSAPVALDSTVSMLQENVGVEISRKSIFHNLDDEITRSRLKMPDELE